MTKEEMQIYLSKLGLKKTYRPAWETESGTILLATRKPDDIVGGKLIGSQITICGDDIFQVWTPRVKKARAVATKHKLKCRILDGEAELFVPPGLADELLPVFGAKVKRASRPFTKAQTEALMARLSKSYPTRNDVPDIRTPESSQDTHK